VNQAHFDQDPQPGLKKTGANAVRMFMYVTDGSVPASRYADAATQHHVGHGEIPIISMPNFPTGKQTTGASNAADFSAGVTWWAANYSTFAPLQKTMILNIANEWGPSGDPGWRSAYIAAVASLRLVGYTCPIMIDAGGSGQDIKDIVDYSADVFASDPRRSVIFSFHFYGLSQGPPYSTVSQMNAIFGQLQALKYSVGAAYVIGEFGPGYAIGPAPTNVTPGEVVMSAEAHGLGWLAWAWDDNNMANQQSDNQSFDFVYAAGRYEKQTDLTIYGQDIVLNPHYGLAANSVAGKHPR
jgi:hypothetical protein